MKCIQSIDQLMFILTYGKSLKSLNFGTSPNPAEVLGAQVNCWLELKQVINLCVVKLHLQSFWPGMPSWHTATYVGMSTIWLLSWFTCFRVKSVIQHGSIHAEVWFWPYIIGNGATQLVHS